ncbi:Bax inhibitor-1/YccA family protein [Candidatus Cytomitobacter primus]|uniref:Bax inhibitor-1/YccA family protein n=1 Tax=Candidatus Cytomitobacter primus TaxID=2066024 RepID=A0A5C0UG24_9PROT|nr:Bax inhibitor-1/YccA family protein [Candidatus Cytomitobacter primus]QEK38749.1 Bax inhibitor-1/YccA family protein [Candidatus Cytomitobacter primus]
MNREHIVHSDSGLRRYFVNIYQNVAIGLGIMGSVAFFMHSIRFYPSGAGGMLIMFLPFIISMALSFNIRSISVETAQLLYIAYSASLGMSLSFVFAIYTGESVFNAFLSTAVVFGVLSYYARTTNKNLSAMGDVLQMALIGMILVGIVNIFIGSSMMSMLLSFATIIIFSGFIVYDQQQLTNLYFSRIDTETKEKIAIIGSLQLLISFVNIFISLLRLFGERRRD